MYRLKGSALETVKNEGFSLEKNIQEIVESNLESLFDLEFVATELSISEFRFDSLAFDRESRSFVIVEYKKKSSSSVIDQGYAYLSTMLNNKAEFILEYNERKSESLKREDVDWSQSRILFISPSFTSYQKNSVNFKDVPFELWEIKRFSGDIICLDQITPSSKESIRQQGNGKNNIIGDVSKEVVVFSEDDTLRELKVEARIKEVYYALKERLSEWEDVHFGAKKNYIAAWKNKSVFAYFIFRKSYIRTHIGRGFFGKKKDGKIIRKKGIKLFTLDDPKKMFNTWENEYKSIYSYDLKKPGDIDYFLLMLKQKYDSI